MLYAHSHKQALHNITGLVLACIAALLHGNAEAASASFQNILEESRKRPKHKDAYHSRYCSL